MEAREDAARTGMRLERLLDGQVLAEMSHGRHYSP
jgi:hypothetical protein